MVRRDNSDTSILLETNLQSFFYQKLQEINCKYTRPLPDETIFYSSLVMDQFGESKKYFEIEEGKVREKVLGRKLLEAGHLSRTHQKAVLRDIGDTALLICGYFNESLNKKLVDSRYYQDLGRMAYERLNKISPSAYDIQDFYWTIAQYFHQITELMEFFSKSSERFSPDDAFLIVNTHQLKVS
jgi:hypothetical protein